MGGILKWSGIGLAARLLDHDKKKKVKPAPMPVTPAGPTPRELADRVQTGGASAASTAGGRAVLGATGGI